MPPERKKTAASTPQALVPEADRSGPKPAFDSEQYNKVARAVQLVRLSLISNRFFILPEFFAEQAEQQPTMRYQAKFKNPRFDPEQGTASCEWDWGIAAQSKQKEKTTTFSAEAVYLLSYSNLKECDLDAVQTYMRRVGRFTSYPYFRAHISQLSWESGANIPILSSIAS